MCGIAGIILKRAVSGYRLAESVKAMSDAMRHRGPDDEGYLLVGDGRIVPAGGDDTPSDAFEGRCDYAPVTHIQSIGGEQWRLVLAHRRLSIIDLSPQGHQPMSYDSGRLWIVYNGEIYNYIELREELTSLGHVFHTSSDTEVVLASYLQWGSDCVSRFNGMWAFVIYDKLHDKIFGARDRFGVKPFYYVNDGDCFAFASEVKALLKLPRFHKRLNEKVLFDYLVMGDVDTEEEQIIEGIFELFPSCAFEVDLGSFSFKKWNYYHLPFHEGWERFDVRRAEEYAKEVRTLVEGAVRLRLRSDVPVGTCLSGGLDSSTLACLINRHLSLPQVGGRQKVFTSVVEAAQIDESRWAAMVVEETGAEWYRVKPDARTLAEELESLVYAQEIPFRGTSIYAQYKVMELAATNGVKVLLDGQGGDEVFAGYACYHSVFLLDLLRNMDLFRLLRECIFVKDRGVVASSLSFMGKVAASFILKSGGMSSRLVLKKLRKKYTQFLNEDFWNDNEERIKEKISKIFATTSLNVLLHRMMNVHSLKHLLRYEDRNSMRFSIEARTPFADDVALIEYVFNIPFTYKIRDGWSKYLLRKAMGGILPEPIRWRKDKIGFATPESSWVNAVFPSYREYLESSVEDFIDVHRMERAPLRAVEKWRILNFLVWRRLFL